MKPVPQTCITQCNVAPVPAYFSSFPITFSFIIFRFFLSPSSASFVFLSLSPFLPYFLTHILFHFPFSVFLLLLFFVLLSKHTIKVCNKCVCSRVVNLHALLKHSALDKCVFSLPIRLTHPLAPVTEGGMRRRTEPLQRYVNWLSSSIHKPRIYHRNALRLWSFG